MHFDGFVIVLMAGIMVIGGGILIAMLALESPWWNLGSRLAYVSTTVRRLRRRLRRTWSREKIRAEEDDQRASKTGGVSERKLACAPRQRRFSSVVAALTLFFAEGPPAVTLVAPRTELAASPLAQHLLRVALVDIRSFGPVHTCLNVLA